MATFRYTGNCAQGYVEFKRGLEIVTMPRGQEVEVPAWLEAKLKKNRFFEQVTEDAVIDADNVIEGEAQAIPEGKGECPDCGNVLSIKKDGTLYAHECAE